MEIRRFEIPGPVVVIPTKLQDDRGFFSEVYNHDRFCANVSSAVFVQDNHAKSVRRGTIRGIHFQIPPHAQEKLVRVTRGAIWDVAVDMRTGSPTFGRHVGVELSADAWNQLWVPIGFGHGYCTLEPDTEVLYKVSARYDPACDRGLAWDDPDLAIDWPLGSQAPSLSDRDRRHPRLKDTPAYFTYVSQTG